MVAPEHDVYLTARQVRERYGNASDSWITRKQREAGFPPHTTRFGGRRHTGALGNCSHGRPPRAQRAASQAERPRLALIPRPTPAVPFERLENRNFG